MTPPADYCEHCDLPLSQCVHGQPPPKPPEKAPAKKPAARTATPRATSRATPQPSVARRPPRRTPQAEFRPFILAALQDSGGRADVEDVMAEIVSRMEGVLRPADHETVNQGEVRWHYAARLERKAMLDEGLILPPREPGIWELTDLGLATTE